MKLKHFIVAAIIIVMIFVYWKYDIQELFQSLLVWIQGAGITGILVYCLAYIVACVLFIPGSILTLGAGAIYKIVLGSILVSIASTLGATLAFLVGRYFARDQIAKKIEGNAKFSQIDKAVEKEGFKIVGLTRLSPVFPFNLLNYAYGLTRVRLRDYVLASWLGMMPGTILYVYIGSLVGDLATLGESGGEKSIAQWALLVVGLVATIAVTLTITRIAKKALTEKVG